jgi:hypothetical protein
MQVLSVSIIFLRMKIPDQDYIQTGFDLPINTGYMGNNISPNQMEEREALTGRRRSMRKWEIRRV